MIELTSELSTKMNGQIPEAGPAFEELMREIDSKFSREGLPIPVRSIRAVIAVGRRFKVSVPIVPSPPNAPPQLQKYNQLCKNIHDWYSAVYGDRVKVTFSPGRIVLVLDGDLYSLALPRIYGTVQFVAIRKFLEDKSFVTRGPGTCNVVQLVEALTPAKANGLSDEALETIIGGFVLALEAHDCLEATRTHKLIEIARGDIQTAVGCLMDTRDRSGESKWASLQAAEKVLKAAIELEGSKYRFGHELIPLCEQLAGLGVTFKWTPLVSNIQCSPGIRYGETSCTREEAVRAHHSSLELVVALARAGAKFKQGLR
jgi:hypothetical protein